MNRSKKILVARMYEKVSGKGNRYYQRRMGDARLVMFFEPTIEGSDLVWELFVEEVEGQGKRPRD